MNGLLIFQELSLEERRQKLKEVAKVTDFNTSYQRTLSQTEVDAQKDVYARGAIEKERLEELMKASSDSFKIQIKAQDDRLQSALNAVKNGKIEVQGDLYGIANYDDKRMCFHDIYGEMIYSRDLTPADGQGDIFKDAKNNGQAAASTTPLGVANQVMKDATNKVTDKGALGTEKPKEPAGQTMATSKEESKGKTTATESKLPGKPEDKPENAKSTSNIDKKGLQKEPIKSQADLQKENAKKNLGQTKTNSGKK